MAEKKNLVLSKPKDGPRKCQVCDMTLPDIYAYTHHLESNDHTKGIMKKKYGAKYLEVRSNLLRQNVEKIMKHGSDGDTSSEDEVEVYACEICKKICTGLLNYKLHIAGKKHRKNTRKAKILKQMQLEKILPNECDDAAEDNLLMDAILTGNEYTSKEIICKVCNKKCSGPEAFKQHNKGVSHKKKLAMRDLLKSEKFEGADDSPTTAKCYVCCKEFSGPFPYQQHMQSESHSKQVQQANQLAKLEDLYICSGDSNKIECKECNKCFSGPKPFETHLKSSWHLKLKQKSELLKTLGKNYPEMVVMPISNSRDSEDEDTAIICNACHTAFTGPESARDHFQSQKHKKVLKEKKRFEKLGLSKNGKGSDGKPKSKEEAEGNLGDGSSDEFDIIP